MRTLIDIPEQILPGLMEICKAAQISRTEAVRRALSQYVEVHTKEKDAKARFLSAFGAWKDAGETEDGVEMQRRLRAEWAHRDPGF